MMDKRIIYVAIALLIAICASSVHADNYYMAGNGSITTTSVINSGGTDVSPQFFVQVLKYEPYPVNPGDSFDVWIEVTNVGQQDAPNVMFQFVPTYPFTTNDSLTLDYGVVDGLSSAYASKLPQDVSGQANQIVIEYRVHVADDAPLGTNMLNFEIYPDKSNNETSYGYQLPIVVGNTRTDFDVIFQQYSSQGTSFSIVNTGQNPAVGVIMSLENQPGMRITGANAAVLGNLNVGDFTTQTYTIAATQRQLSNVTINVTYTDTANNRESIEKVVPVSIAGNFSALGAAGGSASGYSGFSGAGRRTTSSSIFTALPWWVWLVFGVLIGYLIEVLIQKRMRKKNEDK